VYGQVLKASDLQSAPCRFESRWCYVTARLQFYANYLHTYGCLMSTILCLLLVRNVWKWAPCIHTDMLCSLVDIMTLS